MTQINSFFINRKNLKVKIFYSALPCRTVKPYLARVKEAYYPAYLFLAKLFFFIASTYYLMLLVFLS